MKTTIKYLYEKLLFGGILAVILVLSSCSPDEENNPIIGMWGSEYHIENKYENNILIDSDTLIIKSAYKGYYIAEFKSDYTLEFTDQESSNKILFGTYSVLGNEISIYSNDSLVKNAIYTIKNNKLTLSKKYSNMEVFDIYIRL